MQIVENKNREIKRINNEFIRRSIPQIGIGIIAIIVINSLKEMQPYLEKLFEGRPAFQELIPMMNVMMIIVIVMALFISVSNTFRRRNHEVENVEERYENEFEGLMKENGIS